MPFPIGEGQKVAFTDFDTTGKKNILNPEEDEDSKKQVGIHSKEFYAMGPIFNNKNREVPEGEKIGFGMVDGSFSDGGVQV